MATSDTTGAPEPNRGRGVHIALWVAQVLLAAFFAFTAANKFLGAPAEVELFDHIGIGQWFRYVTGAIELAGAVGLLIPRLSGLAALGLLGVMVGATLTNLFVVPDGAQFAAMTVALGLMFVLVAWGRWPQTKALAAMLKR